MERAGKQKLHRQSRWVNTPQTFLPKNGALKRHLVVVFPQIYARYKFPCVNTREIKHDLETLTCQIECFLLTCAEASLPKNRGLMDCPGHEFWIVEVVGSG